MLSQLASPGFFHLQCIRVQAYFVHCLVFNRDKNLVLVKIEFSPLFTDPRIVSTFRFKVPLDFEVQQLDFNTNHIVLKAVDRQGLHKLFFYRLEKTRSCQFPHFSKSLAELVDREKAARFKFAFDRETESSSRLITLPAKKTDHLYDVYDIGDHLLELRCRDRKCAANYSLLFEDLPADSTLPRALRLLQTPCIKWG